MLTLLLLLGCGSEYRPGPGRGQGQGPPRHGRHGPGAPGQGPGVPGDAMVGQDPTGFPGFHDREAPAGPPITAAGTWQPAVRLTVEPSGGYRPQIAASADGLLHAVYYDRTDAGDIIRHRTSSDGLTWSPPARPGYERDRNWGPDLVARADGSVVLVFDHTRDERTVDTRALPARL